MAEIIEVRASPGLRASIAKLYWDISSSRTLVNLNRKASLQKKSVKSRNGPALYHVLYGTTPIVPMPLQDQYSSFPEK